MPKRIFISYRHIEPDQTVARQVAEALTQHHAVFIDLDIRPGGEWGEDIEHALQTADFVVALLSEVAAQSPMVITEIETAHRRRLKTGQPVIIPVRLGFDKPLRFPLSAYVNRFQHIVWSHPNDTTTLIDELLGTINAGTQKHASIHALNLADPHKKFSWLARTQDHVLLHRNRLRMIDRVKHDWIDGVLKRSLYQVARIGLGFVEKSDAVDSPIKPLLQRPYEETFPLPRNIRIGDVFDEQLGQLLILGAPGSGKTTLLLELANELLDRAKKDECHPIPVVFNLASWAVAGRTLAAWIVDELNESYDVPRRIALEWVSQEQILPMLDGLDEIQPEHRDMCVQSINAFRKEHGFVPIVVCSRVSEYETLTTRLRLPGAIAIQPLTPRQVYEYLEGATHDSLIGLRRALQQDPILMELFDNPLMLSISMLAYRSLWQLGVQGGGSLEEHRHRLFAAYVDAMLQRRLDGTYSRGQTIHSLVWIARCLKKHDLTMLAIESLNSNWVSIPRQVVPIMIGTITAVVLGLLGSAVASGYDEVLIVGLGYGGVFGLIAWRVLKSEGVLRPVDAFHFSSAWLSGAAGTALFFAVAAAGLAGREEGVATGVFVGVLSGLAALLFRGLGEGLIEKEIIAQSRPNERTWHSARSALTFVLFCIAAFAVALAPLQIFLVSRSGEMHPVLNGLWSGSLIGSFSGLFFGLLGALSKGGLFFIQHFVLRVFSWYKGLAPLNYVRFLDYAADHLFLYKVGGSYIFVHRMLMEYFASLENQAK